MDEYCRYYKTYSDQQTAAIASEFKRLSGQHYLEHAGATLYSELQLKNIFSQFSENLYSNPHSSKATDDAIDIVRYQILTHFKTNPQEYSVVFTSGATAALKLLAENFTYDGGSLVYLQDNHTSALGLRAYTTNSKCLKPGNAYNCFAGPATQSRARSGNSLFIYPAQSNFSGVKYPLAWILKTRNGHLNSFISQSTHWFVALDAASYAGTNPLNLTEFKPDFVTISFYKMFGYPTGLGALLVRNSSCEVLGKRYFGGGAVSMAQTLHNTVVLKDILHERFEDGTVPFLSIIALKEGFSTVERLGLSFSSISKHTYALARFVYRSLKTMHHCNGRPVAVLYHPSDFDDVSVQGGIVNFNLLRESGEYFGYSEILHFSGLYNIQLRTGCFCNPGGCQHFLQLTPDDVQRHFDAGHVCGDQLDLINGYPTGSVRISFGFMSTKDDADKFLQMIEDCFVAKPILRQLPELYLINSPSQTELRFNNTGPEEGTLMDIILYPVKSCGGFSVPKWPITGTGLKYDRQWMIINSSGICVSQKTNRKLCLITPKISLEANTLQLHFPNHRMIVVSIETLDTNSNSGRFCQSKVCGDKIEGWDCGDTVADWLSEALETPGLRLLKQGSLSEDIISRTSKQNQLLSLSLANKAQYLLVNSASVQWLRGQITDENFKESAETTVQRFRPNFLVQFYNPFSENAYKQCTINGLKFQVGGACTRCQMICIDQNTGDISKEPLQSLSRAFKGRITFGIYLNRGFCNKSEILCVGDKVQGLRK